MPLIERNAELTWRGDLRDGSGRLKVGSGAFPDQDITFRGRTEGGSRLTSPEELIAAAHAICYSMSLTNHLSHDNKTPPESLHVSAACALDRIDGGLKISHMTLNVEGDVPGLSAEDFRRLASGSGAALPGLKRSTGQRGDRIERQARVWSSAQSLEPEINNRYCGIVLGLVALADAKLRFCYVIRILPTLGDKTDGTNRSTRNRRRRRRHLLAGA